jgi:hypothetical protein
MIGPGVDAVPEFLTLKVYLITCPTVLNGTEVSASMPSSMVTTAGRAGVACATAASAAPPVSEQDASSNMAVTELMNERISFVI